MRQAFHLVNGINTFPGCSTNWNGRGVTWLHVNTEAKAEKIEYFCGPIGRAFGQKDRALKLNLTLNFYRDWENHVVGHSNGAAVALAMMRDYRKWPDLEHLHLVCGACEADFEKNGLNHWMREGRVRRVTIYIGGKDWALRLAHSLPARILGYGVMGLHGPLNVADDVAERVGIVRESPWNHFGHSTCWSARCFNTTMETLSGELAPL
jgi:pimeloyl-ACP methyl ester carboxylesterase